MNDLRDRLQRALGSAYAIERELGGGGMSRVFVAMETALGRQVVIKVLPPELEGAVSAERFRREIALAARLQHPNIVPLLSAGEADGLLWYTMPFVKGESLRARIVREGELPIDDCVRIARDVARALAYAHRNGVVHRDIKPENILLSDDATLVADFGVARALHAATEHPGTGLTSGGIALGTPAYMAPEQAAAEPGTDQRADIYAFGITTYEMLTGQAPFAGRPTMAVLAAHMTEAVEPPLRRRPATPAALDAIVMRCVVKRPADRYQNAADVVAALEGIGSGATPAVRANGRASSTIRTGIFAGAAIVGCLVALAIWRAARPGARSTDRPIQSIVVLPFANAGGDSANEYFSDGMTDELASALGKIDGLRVAARSSAYAFKGQNADVHRVAEKLGVSSVLEGSIRRAGSRLRVTAELVNGKDGLTLWSETYEREVKDVFQVQDDIARAIVAALRLRLTGAQQVRIVRTGTDNVQAYELYLKGMYFWDRFSEGDIHRGIDYFQQALAIDSNYAPAWAGIAGAWTDLADDWVSPREAYPKAKAAAMRALALDSTLALAHSSLGIELVLYDWDIGASGRETRRAVELDPTSAAAHVAYSVDWAARGEYDSSLAEMRRAQQLDPLDAHNVAMIGWVQVMIGRTDDGERECRSALEIQSDLEFAKQCLGDALFARKHYAEALAMYHQAGGLPATTQSRVARTLIALGRRDDAERALAALKAAAKRRYIRPEEIAIVHVDLGERDSAFAWLERAYQERSSDVVLIRNEPRWDPIRGDPRFAALLKRVGPP